MNDDELRQAHSRLRGSPVQGEMLHFTNRMQPAHLFDCYAMANSTLCGLE